MSAPSHGSVEMPAPITGTLGFAYYISDIDYVGGDSFTWRVNDGKVDSNVATATITVTAVAPVPQPQTAAVKKDLTTDVSPVYTGGGYDNTFVVLSPPSASAGTVTVVGDKFRFVPAAGYTGVATFSWKMTYSNATTPETSTDSAICTLYVTEDTHGDWPTFRANAYRNALTTHDLPSTLHLQWTRDLPAPLPAWSTSGNQRYSDIDRSYEPVVAGSTMFVPINRNDCVVALNTETGAEVWRFYAEGPVRMAPIVYNGKVLFGSDDGWFYCVDAITGDGIWKRRTVPCTSLTLEKANRKVLGNRRMVSPWVVRGGPMLVDGKIYFTSGLMPKEGVFIWCLDPDTGDIIWLDEDAGCRRTGSDGSPWLGFCPQGYLVRQAEHSSQFWVPASKQQAVTFSLDASGAGINAPSYDPIAGVELLGTPGAKNQHSWVVACDNDALGPVVGSYAWPTTIVAGSKMYTAANAAALGVVGTVHSMVAANDRLFVVTKTGSVYCFGGTDVADPTVWDYNEIALPNTQDTWTTKISDILSASTVGDSEGIAMVWGITNGRSVEELIKQSNLHVIVIDPDEAEIAALRDKLVAAGVYGTRVGVFVGDPVTANFPPHMARFIVSEDLAGAGFASGQAFVEKIYQATRPYGGQVWLSTTSTEHDDIAALVTAAALPNADIVRNGDFTVLSKVGKLPGAREWTAANGKSTQIDQALRAPYGFLWWGGTSLCPYSISGFDMPGPDLTEGCYASTVDAYTGFTMQDGAAASGARDLGWEIVPGKIDESPSRPRKNPWTGLFEQNYAVFTSRCGPHMRLGKFYVGASHTPNAGFYAHDAGVITIAPAKEVCGDSGAPTFVPANGVMYMAYQGGCSCEFPLAMSAALVHSPQVENWSYYSGHRIHLFIEEDPMVNLAINFGAPAEHVGQDREVWIHQPHLAARVSLLSARFTPEVINHYYHHSIRMESADGPAWVAASGVKGVSQIRIPLTWPVVARQCDAGPVLDGVLDDTCWESDYEITLANEGAENFTWDLPVNKAARHFGKAYVSYDDQNLYIAGFGKEWGGATVASALDNGRDWKVYVTDRGNYKEQYLAFIVSDDGVTSAIEMRHGASEWARTIQEWNGAWTGVGVANTNGFGMEFSIPWATLAAEGYDKDDLCISIQGPMGIFLRGDWEKYLKKNQNSGYMFTPVSYDVLTGQVGSMRDYTVRLHFAETEGAIAGERIFDLSLQGNKVLSNFDIVAQAGGPNRGIVREFTGIQVKDELVIDMDAINGETVLCGVELKGQFELPNHAPYLYLLPASRFVDMEAGGRTSFAVRNETLDPDGDTLSASWKLDGVAITSGVTLPPEFPPSGEPCGSAPAWSLSTWAYTPAESDVGTHELTVEMSDGQGGVTPYTWVIQVTGTLNEAPDAVASVDVRSGMAPMTANFSAVGSIDPDGTITNYKWIWGDGTTNIGDVVTHIYEKPGSYPAQLWVTDNDGARRRAIVMVYVFGETGVPEYTSALIALGEKDVAFNYLITSKGSQPITNSVSDLPAWLSFDGTNMLSGIPPAVATHNVTLTAVNKEGSTTETLVLTVLDTPPVNIAPTISGVADQIVDEDVATGSIALTIGDNYTPTEFLMLSAVSDNLALVPVKNIAFGGSYADRTVVVTPALNQNGAANLTIIVTDSGGLTASSSFLLTVNPVADAPLALDDKADTVVNTAVTVDVLANDYDPDGDSIALVDVSEPRYGVAVNNGSTVTYTPYTGWVGTDTFAYTISDGVLESVATVVVTVSELIVDNEDAVVVGDWIVNVDSGFGDYYGANNLLIEKAAGVVDTVKFTPNIPTTGEWDVYHYNQTQLNGAPNTKVVIVRAGGTSTTTIDQNSDYGWVLIGTYTFNAGTAGSVTISNDGVDESPTIVFADAVKFMWAAGPPPEEYLLDASSSENGTIAPSGLVRLLEGGSQTFTMTPDLNCEIIDVVVDGVSEGPIPSRTFSSVTEDHTIVASFAVIPNRAPVARDDRKIMFRNLGVVVDVFGNDSDADADALTLVSVSDPAHGTVVNNGGNVTYQPDVDWFGLDTFTYTISDGELTGTATVTMIPDDGPDLICTIRSKGGDYTSLSAWETALQSDLTLSSSMTFGAVNFCAYDSAVDDGGTVTFAGGGTGTLKHISLLGKAYIVGCSGVIQTGTVICDVSGHTFTIVDAGQQIGVVAAECYNDWPATGLDDYVFINEWVTDADHYVRIYTPESERHTGKLKDGSNYTGFTIAPETSTVYAIKVYEAYTRIEGIAVDVIAATRGYGIQASLTGCVLDSCLVNGAKDPGGNGHAYLASVNTGAIVSIRNCIAQNSQNGFYVGFRSIVYLYNCTAVNSTQYGFRIHEGNNNNLIFRNCLSDNAETGGIDFSRDLDADGVIVVEYCAASDTTVGDWGGTGNRSGQTFTYVDESNSDFHLAASDVGAQGYGMDLSGDLNCAITVDIDGETRSGTWDIGADEISGGAAIDPVCVITAPVNGAMYAAPASVIINANASSPSGTVTKVEFYYGTTKLGEDATSPYGYTWTDVAAGSYSLTAKATDDGGVVTTSVVVSITVDVIAPQITSSLTASATAGQPFTYTVTASGSIPITYGASGLPTGLSLAGAVISGTPVSVETSSVTLTATNSEGTDTETLVLTIIAAPVPTYTITANSGVGGTLTPSGEITVNEGDSSVFVIGENVGYETADVLVDGVLQGVLPSYTFSNVITDHTISVSFSIVADTESPTVPSSLVAVAASSVQVDLTWAASTDNISVAGYDIRRGGVLVDTAIGTNYSDVGLAPDTAYTYTVAAFDTAGNRSAVSSAVAVSTPAVQDMLAHWMLDETTGEVAYDATGNGHSGTLISGPSWTTNGQIGGALILNDLNDRVELDVPLAPGAENTIAVWFTAPLMVRNWLDLVSGDDGASFIKADSYILGINNGSFVGCGFDMNTLSDGWHHVAAVATGTVTEFYIDGVHVGTSAGKVTVPVMVLGNDYNGGSALSPTIDDVRIYGRALSAGEIAVLAGVVDETDTDGDGMPDDIDLDDDGDGMPDVWEIAHGFNPLVNEDTELDPDTDGMSNLDESICGTDPYNENSKLETGSLTLGGSGIAVTFDTVVGRLYGVEYKDDLLAATWQLLTNDVQGTGGAVNVNDPELIGRRFYRIRVMLDE